MFHTRSSRRRLRTALQTAAVVIGSSLAIAAFLDGLGGSLASGL